MKKILLVASIIFCLVLQIIPGYTATNEGYGEDSNALGQFVDSFENSQNVSVTDDVIRNSTLEAMELEHTYWIPDYENYSLYTEADANNRYTVSDRDIVVESLSNFDNGHHVTYDYGASFFTDFQHDFEAKARDNSGTAGNDRMYVWLLANVTDDPNDMATAGDRFIGVYFQEFDNSDPNDPEITLRERRTASWNLDKYEPASLDTWYYFRVNKTGTSLVCGIYSNATARDAGNATDGDLDNLNVTLEGDYNYRYIYAVSGVDDGHASTRLMSGNIENHTIGTGSLGYQPDGYFTTVDYFDDPYVNGSSRAVQVNTSIPSGTAISLQFSSDNITWEDASGVDGLGESLNDGFDTVDMRDLNYSSGAYYRFNLTTNNSLITPRVYQVILISSLGYTASSGGTGSGGIGFFMLILILTPALYLLVVKK